MSTRVFKNNGLFRSDLAELLEVWEDAPPFTTILVRTSEREMFPVIVIDPPDCPELTLEIMPIPFGRA